MILNHGNIKNSNFLRYLFFDNLLSEEHHKKCNDYLKTIKRLDIKKYVENEKYFHDAIITIKEYESTIKIGFIFLNEVSGKEETIFVLFKNAKILSWNKVRKSGHIARLNKQIIPYQYGYSEFYTDKGNNYISMVVFPKSTDKTNTGIYFPIVTIKFEEIEIEIA
jgi:hypothetical protein